MPTAARADFEFLITFAIISMDLEYLAALKTLNTRMVRNILITFSIRKTLKTLKALLISVMLGKMETRSTMAMKVKGYFTKDTAFALPIL